MRERKVRFVGFVSVVAVYASLLASVSNAAAQTGAYEDVPSNVYYSQPVAELAAQGVFEGTECAEGLCPGEPMDRKTMAVWTVRVLDGQDPPAISQTRFNDVDAASFHAPFIERMAELGVTRGCGDGSGFCPDRTVTRAQMAVFLSRAYDLQDGPVPGFSDVPSNAWYAADVARLAASGITVGCGDGTRFCPSGDTTRAQMASFLWRAENPNWRDGPSNTPLALNPAMDGGGVVGTGVLHSCRIRADQTITCWGTNDLVQRDVPAGKFTAVAAGGWHSCGIRADQTITCWGNKNDWQSDAPAGRFAAVSAGGFHSCGIRADQTIVCWGQNRAFDRQTLLGAPAGRFTSVSAGDLFSCALRIDQTVTCWGWNLAGQASAPDGRFMSVSAGYRHACAIRADGTVVCWGLRDAGQTEAPAGTFIAVSSGERYSCGIGTEGTVACWGLNNSILSHLNDVGQAMAPAGEFTAVAAGSSHACGLGNDQTITCWGDRSIHLDGGGLDDDAVVEDPSDDGTEGEDPSDDETEGGDPHDDEVVQRPGAPRNVRIDWIEGNSLTVHWQAPETGGTVNYYGIDRTIAGAFFPSVGIRTGQYGRYHHTIVVSTDSNFQESSPGNFSYTVYFAVSENDYDSPNIESTDSVRVVAFNTAGFEFSGVVSVPSAASADHHTLRAFVEDLVS